MKHDVLLTTDRLVLRPLQAGDANDVQRLAGAYEVALNTLSVPHPYPDGAAAEWIAKIRADENEHVFAITLRTTGELVGVIGLRVTREWDRAELGYWLGVPFWSRGYASEAARALVDYGFEALKLNKIHAAYFARNEASGNVMRKLGMRHEGSLRQHHKKWGEYIDVEMYSILRREWTPRASS